MASGGVLDGGQRRVYLERLSKVLDAIGSEAVLGDAANGKGTQVSAAADTFPNYAGVGVAARLSNVSVLLILRASDSLMIPSAV